MPAGAMTAEKGGAAGGPGDRWRVVRDLAIAATVLAVFLSILVWMSGGVPAPYAVLGLWAGALVVVGAGDLLLTAAGAGRFPGRVALAAVCGFVVTAMAQLAGVFLLGLDAVQSFVIWSGAVGAAALLFPRAWTHHAAGDGADGLVLAFVAVLVLFAFRHHVGVLPLLAADGILLSADSIIHGAQLAQFGDPLGAGRGSLLLAGVPLGLYHYGYYMPVAAIMRLFDLTPLAAEAALLVPLGVLVGAWGAYALASVLAGRLAGLMALGLLFALPDGAHLGIGNRFFGFQTVMLFEPGSGYAVGGALAALACFERGRRSGGTRMWLLAAVLTVALFQLRAHLFVLFAPVMTALFLSDIPLARRHRPQLILAALALAVAGIVAVAAIPSVRGVVAGFSNAPAFFTIALDALGPTLRDGLFGSLVATHGMGPALALGLIAVFVAILGVLLAAYPLALLMSRLRRGTTSLDAFPLLLLAAYAGLILLAPRAPFSDPNTEFQHRPLVLVYAVFAVFTAVLAARALRLDRPELPAHFALPLAAAMTALNMLVPLAGLYRVEWLPPGLTDFFYRPVDRGLLPMALQIRAASGPGMTLAVADIRSEDGNIDSCAELAGISGVPCYLSRPSVEARVDAAQRDLVARRLATLDAIAGSADLDTALGAMKAAGLSWYVVRGAAPSFDPEGRGAVMRNGFGALYHVPPISDP